MDLPVIETPIFPRWVWIEEITYSHIPIATVVTAFMLLAPVLELYGYLRKDPRFERLSKSFIWFAMILFSPGAALGTGIPMWIIGTYPEFWSRFANLFFWPLIVQFIFFLVEVFFLFFFYYLTWDIWIAGKKKRLHIWMGFGSALCGLAVQCVWDMLGGYMLTPGGVPFPAVDQPVGLSWAALFNPSFPYLFGHRIFGNFSYVLLLTGGVFAFRHLAQRKKNPDGPEYVYFRWASNWCLCAGFFFYFGQPIVGWFYARLIQREAPIAFMAIMGGHSGSYFIIKMALIAIILSVGGMYLTRRFAGRKFAIAATAGLLIVLAVLLAHPPLDWFGGHGMYRIVTTGGLLALVAGLWFFAGKGNPDAPAWQWAKFVVGLAAFFAFCMGGFVREHSKNPDTVYQEIVKPEFTDFEADRRLVYDKWLLARGITNPEILDRHPPADWREAVENERANGLELTDEQTDRIVSYLEKHHR